MSKQYPGGIISKTAPVPSGPYSNDTAPGIWTLEQQAYWQKLGQWPNANNPPLDPQFNYVTMLLHGDGTNGAQNNTFLDSSGNTFTITRNGNTTQGSFSPYGSNWSNYFPGGTNLFLATATALGTGNVTVEFWFYPTDVSATYYGLYDGRTAANTNTGLGIFQYGQTIEIYGNGLKVSTAANAFTGNTWTHFAVVRTSGTCQIYINGVASGSSASYSDNFTSTTRTIGSNVSTANVYAGYISNLREVTSALYSSTFTPSTTPLTAISGTTLLTCQSNRFIDNSANNYAITFSIAYPTVQRFNPFGTATAYSTAVIGGSGYFDGTGDYLSTPNSSSFAFGTGNFTVEFWYRGTDTGGGFGLTTGGSTGYWQLNLSGSTMYWQNDVGVSNLLSVSASPILNDAWNHVAVVRNSTALTIYFNGVSVTSTSDTTNYSGTGGNLQLGLDSNVNYITGYIADYRIVKGTAVYTANFTPPTAPLTAITNTSLLLSMTNGAIFDNAMMNDLETVGNAQISTSVVKYGTGSLYFDGTGDALSTPNTIINSLGSGAFTIEMWVYRLGNGSGGISAYDALLGSYSAPGTAVYGIYITRSTGVINFFNSAGLVSSSNSLSNSSWTHIAVCRTSANNLQIFINGTSGYSATNTGTGTLTNPFYIASDGTGSGGNSNFYGYIDDLRITKGYARYTANFTPPTAAFFNYGPN